MKKKDMLIYLAIAVLIIALLLWYLLSSKQKSTPTAPPPVPSITQAPKPAAPAMETPPPAVTAPPAEQPAPQAAQEPPPPPPEPAKPASYTVTRGDCLWRIAARPDVYGNPLEWPLLYKANQNKIKDADLIHPGQMLVINHHPTAAEVAAAIQHAKTRGPWTLGKVEPSDKAYLAQ